ncbi:MAG: 30S ribosomal protein S3ae [Methanosphaera sp.]|uniref:30S ribosomal protein S3ae n=1 Tax=Methanosphaera sp. TaxID=2666342 RepID=UPI0025ECEE43|nr:30S ribosomal protein S3ae [Methanosphaera sp.]MCI5867381.1 30S ribosomal protein S3ae [Methanosphaera sp.]MDD6534551.1 30S ribosomal protein S3ae [Methanosphaera sp.]MDY3955780.1 30S ribosomal protein S3ae [Methanosphaera sp.]
MAKARRRVRDTWKEKIWYDILAPEEFNEESLGTSPAREPEMLVGRKIETSMRELNGDFSRQYVKLFFEVDHVSGEVAHTVFTGHKVTSDYVRSMIRRGTSRIDTITSATTKDGVKLDIHILAITVKRAKASQQKLIRETMRRMVVENAAEKNLNELVKDIISGKFASNIYHEAKKIYPLKKVETIKSKVN